MPMINLSLEHGSTLHEARASLERAVNEIQGVFGAMIRRAAWTGDRDRVRIEGSGFWVEMSVDEREVHAKGDIPFLAGLLSRPTGGSLERILERRFKKPLT